GLGGGGGGGAPVRGGRARRGGPRGLEGTAGRPGAAGGGRRACNKGVARPARPPRFEVEPPPVEAHRPRPSPGADPFLDRAAGTEPRLRKELLQSDHAIMTGRL